MRSVLHPCRLTDALLLCCSEMLLYLWIRHWDRWDALRRRSCQASLPWLPKTAYLRPETHLKCLPLLAGPAQTAQGFLLGGS